MAFFIKSPRCTSFYFFVTIIFVLASNGVGFAEGVDCIAPCDEDSAICTYHVKVNLFAGELGYFTFDECVGDDGEGIINPTIGMQVGKTYKFSQSDRTNYYHPMGFAYYPDGAHDEKDELEPGIVPPGSSSTCDANNSCPAPMYHENGIYLGQYSNLPTSTSDATIDDGSAGNVGDTITIEQVNEEGDEDAADFGLDFYEPKFFHPLGDWLSYGPFEIMLRFDVEDFNNDLFYFCHIHQFMSGRIKLLDENNEPINEEDVPSIEYEYDVIAPFDEQCGTFNTSDYQLPHAECPERFVCDSKPELKNFAECMDAMNCAMMVGMTSDAMTSEIALFIHQMIPHHQNAVNMAKALLKSGGLGSCDDLTNEDDVNCVMEMMMREIINGQNAQIQTMRSVLEAMEEPAYADCVVHVLGEFGVKQQQTNSGSSSYFRGSDTVFSYFGVAMAMTMGLHFL